ncbi:MAG: DinB family protein [Chloroflexi bacterium]|nr:DinB family protein [Chloroflexota bacterium]MBI3740539.1 DinB family protein [Chloroflexota bacterium]
MNAANVLQMQYDRMAQEFTNTLGNLGAQKLAWRPAPRANDIASMLWHSARAWDGYLNFLDGAAEVFVTQDWATRFGMSQPKNAFDGVYSEAQVAFVRARPKLLVEYVGAILERTKNFLDASSADQLAALVKIPWWPEEKPKAFVLAHVIRHSYEHLGEAQYVKGLMKEKSIKPKVKRQKAKRK